MAYKSDIDIKLSEIPRTTDPSIFPDLVDIYNAIHILTQYSDRANKLRDNPSGDESTPPWQAVQFDKYFYSRAYHSISAGMVCTIVNTECAWNGAYYTVQGVVRGVGGSYHPKVSPFPDPHRLHFGSTYIALEDASPGQLVKLGIGPGILKLPGIELGEPVLAKVWATDTQAGTSNIPRYTLNVDGGLYRIPYQLRGVNTFGLRPIGQGVAPNAAMIVSGLDAGGAVWNED